MDNEQKLAHIQRKTRQRLGFTLVTLLLYFSYALNYSTVGAFLGDKIGGTHITGSLVMFACLILTFIGLELLFLGLNRDREE